MQRINTNLNSTWTLVTSAAGFSVRSFLHLARVESGLVQLSPHSLLTTCIMHADLLICSRAHLPPCPVCLSCIFHLPFPPAACFRRVRSLGVLLRRPVAKLGRRPDVAGDSCRGRGAGKTVGWSACIAGQRRLVSAAWRVEERLHSRGYRGLLLPGLLGRPADIGGHRRSTSSTSQRQACPTGVGERGIHTHAGALRRACPCSLRAARLRRWPRRHGYRPDKLRVGVGSRPPASSAVAGAKQVEFLCMKDRLDVGQSAPREVSRGTRSEVPEPALRDDAASQPR